MNLSKRKNLFWVGLLLDIYGFGLAFNEEAKCYDNKVFSKAQNNIIKATRNDDRKAQQD